MRQDLVNILNNVDEENIAKLAILLADADAVLFDAERAKLTGVYDASPEEIAEMGSLMMEGKQEEVSKVIAKINSKKEESAKKYDVKIMDAKKEFRQIGIVADMVKLIVENRKVQIRSEV